MAQCRCQPPGFTSLIALSVGHSFYSTFPFGDDTDGQVLAISCCSSDLRFTSIVKSDNIMGNSESTPTPPVAGRRRPQQPSSPTLSLDEKFDAIRIDHHHSSFSAHSVLSSSDPEHVSGARTTQYVRELLKDSKNRLGLSALSTANPSTVLEVPSAILKDTQTFNLSIPHEGSPVTNQRSSGRCWIFAATNVFRIAIQQKYDIKNFELSQAYLFFWDKVEKANYFLESILDTAEEYEVDSRLVSALMASPVGDGGQWDMIVNLVAKYGIVPQTLYPDSWNAQNSSTMDRLLTTKLREDGLKLRALRKDGVSAGKIASAKEAMMQDVVRVLTLCLGPPPAADEKFTWVGDSITDSFIAMTRFAHLSKQPLI